MSDAGRSGLRSSHYSGRGLRCTLKSYSFDTNSMCCIADRPSELLSATLIAWYLPGSIVWCQSAFDRDPRSASKRDPLGLRFGRLAFAPSELVGVAETGRARVDV